MTSLRWDNAPKRHVERPAALPRAPKGGSRNQPSFRDRIEEVSGARTERQGPSRSASAAASMNGPNREYGRCSACKAQGVTLWQAKGLLVCGICRPVNRIADTQSIHRQEQDLPKAARSKGTASVVVARRGITWAADQGASDRNTGTVCQKYKKFLRTYELTKSSFTLRMWDAYRLAKQPAPQNTARPGSKRGPSTPPDAPQGRTPAAAQRKSRKHARRARPNRSTPRPKRKKYWTGLSVYDSSTPRRKTARRYNLVEPRRSDLSPENAALLMKVNQQNTLVDMWR
jgi:hypothetical protein